MGTVSDIQTIVIAMPLCRGRGVPVVWFQASQSAIDHSWDTLEPFIRGQAIERFEQMREERHGDTARLPTLEPNAWRLSLVDKVLNYYELRPSDDLTRGR